MNKPLKPTPDFPLYAHSRGQWAKKVNGKTLYYGPWDDPQGALARFQGRLISVPTTNKSVKVNKPKKPHKDFPLYVRQAVAKNGLQLAGKIA